jgi:hypothetical protein
MLDQMAQPPPATPKVSLAMSWADLSPEEKAAMAILAFQDPQLAQLFLQKGGDPAYLAKIKGDIAQTQIKEGTKAQVERGRVDYQAMQTAIEGMLHARELDQTDKESLMGMEDQGGDPNTLG